MYGSRVESQAGRTLWVALRSEEGGSADALDGIGSKFLARGLTRKRAIQPNQSGADVHSVARPGK